jgi:hypothetical protein
MYLILGIVFLALGLLMILRPQVFFELVESWKSDSPGEPSRMYLLSTRFGGVLVAAVGIASIVVNFL